MGFFNPPELIIKVTEALFCKASSGSTLVFLLKIHMNLRRTCKLHTERIQSVLLMSAARTLPAASRQTTEKQLRKWH